MKGRYGVVTFAIVIALASWAISYSTQVGVVMRHGFLNWQAAGWPVCTEAAAIAVMLLLVLGEIRRGLPTAAAWGLVIACLVATTWINWLADPADLVGAGLHSWTPVLSVAVFLLLVHGRPVRIQAALDVPDLAAEVMPSSISGPQLPQQAQQAPRAHTRPPTSNRQRVERLLASVPNVTSGQAAKQLGISRATAGRLLKELRERRPRVLEASGEGA